MRRLTNAGGDRNGHRRSHTHEDTHPDADTDAPATCATGRRTTAGSQSPGR